MTNDKLKAACQRIIDRDRPHEDYWLLDDHDEHEVALSLRARLDSDDQLAERIAMLERERDDARAAYVTAYDHVQFSLGDTFDLSDIFPDRPEWRKGGK